MKKYQRILSLFLVLVMCLGMLQIPAMAAENEEGNESVTESSHDHSDADTGNDGGGSHDHSDAGTDRDSGGDASDSGSDASDSGSDASDSTGGGSGAEAKDNAGTDSGNGGEASSDADAGKTEDGNETVNGGDDDKAEKAESPKENMNKIPGEEEKADSEENNTEGDADEGSEENPSEEPEADPEVEEQPEETTLPENTFESPEGSTVNEGGTILPPDEILPNADVTPVEEVPPVDPEALDTNTGSSVGYEMVKTLLNAAKDLPSEITEENLESAVRKWEQCNNWLTVLLDSDFWEYEEVQEANNAVYQLGQLIKAFKNRPVLSEAARAFIDAVNAIPAFNGANAEAVYEAGMLASELADALSEEDMAIKEVQAALISFQAACAEMFGMMTLETGETSLEDYFDTYDVNGSITISATDMNDKAVEEKDNKPVFVVGNKYWLTLNIYADAFKPGEYVYQLPDYVKVVEQLNNEIKAGDVIIGSWSINTAGKVSLSFNKEASGKSEITAYAKVKVQFQETSTTNPMIGDIQVVINPPEVKVAALAKDGSQNLRNEAGNQALYWKIEFTGGTPGSGKTEQIVGKTLTDTTDEKHGFTSLVEFGVRIDGEDHTWLVGPADQDNPAGPYHAELTKDAQGHPIGWSYTIPEEVVCKDCGETIRLEDSYSYWAFYYSDPIDTANKESETYHNEVRIDGTTLRDDDDVTLTFKYGGAVVSKKVENYNADGQKFARKWTVDVKISPVPAESTDKYPAYTLWDHFVIEDANKHEIANFKDNFDEFAKDFKVTIDGKEVPSVVDAWYAGCESEYAYLKTGGSIVIGMRYDPNDSRHYCTLGADRQLGSDGKGYCTCWRATEEKTVTITYYTDDDKMLDLMAQYGQVGMRLVNYVDLNTRLNTDTPEYKWITKDDATALLDGLFDKQQGTAGSVPVGSEVDYTITLNEGNYVLTDDELHVVDNMTGLEYVDGSIRVTSTPKGGQPSDLSPDAYKVDWDEDSATLTVTLLNTVNTTNSYTVTYKAKVVGDANGNAQFSNSASVDMFGKTFTREVTPEGSGSIGSDSKGFSITVLKTEKDHNDVLLSGAVFGLYNAQTNVKMTEGTTGADGKFVFKTDTSGEKMVILKEHTLYYIQELSAPDGYVKDDARHYFYFCQKDGVECEACDALNSSLPKPEESEKSEEPEVRVKMQRGTVSGTSTQPDVYNSTGALLIVENEPEMRKITLKKVDEADTSKGLAGAKFDLYEVGKLDALKTYETDDGGNCAIEDLRVHKLYRLVETAAPEGYDLPTNVNTYFYFGCSNEGCETCRNLATSNSVDVVQKCDNGGTLQITNKKTPEKSEERVYSVKLTKVDKNTRTTLSGAVFGLFEGVQDAGNSAIATATTGSNGICTFNSKNEYGLTAHKLYYLQELTAPNGYELNSDPHYFYFCDHEGAEDTCDACDAMEHIVGANPVKGLEFDIIVENTQTPPPPYTPPATPTGKDDDDDDGDDDSTPPSRTPGNPPEEEVPVEDVPVPLSEIAEEDIPLAEIPDEDIPQVEILEEDVPLSDVPKTGDSSGIWTMLALLSLAGLLSMSALERKKREENA